MDEFLSKPFQRQQLVAMLAKVTAPGAANHEEQGASHGGQVACGPREPAAPVEDGSEQGASHDGQATRGPRDTVAPVAEGSTERSGTPASAPVLDRETLEEIRALQRPGRPDLAAQLLHMFLDKSPQQLEAIAHAVASGDADAAMRTAHEVKGASGNLGLRALYEAAGRVEASAKGGRQAELVHALEPLRRAHQAAVAAVLAELRQAEAELAWSPHV